MNRVAALYLSFLTIVVVVECQNATIDWLIKYKFIQVNDKDNTNNVKLINNNFQIINGVKEFQRTAGFPVTGYLDDTQINATRGPVCLSSTVTSWNGTKQQVLFWGRTELTWRYFQPYNSKHLPSSYIMEAMIQRALDVWTQDLPLKIYKERGPGRADINVHFYHYDHSRQSPRCRQYTFDGPGGVLGHGFYPEVGELHLDLSEHWGIFKETDSASSHHTDLFSVIYHEFGHVLGLQHSPYVLDTAMKFSYTPPQYNWRYYKINPYDARAIKRLYPGNNRKPSIGPWDTTTTAITKDEFKPSIRDTPSRNPYETPQPTTPTTINPPVRLFDSVIGTSNEVILIKGQYLWRLGYHGILRGYPTKLDRFFSGYNVPKVVDSIYKRSVDNYIIIFSDDLYYRYNGNRLVRGYPKRIVDLLGVNERIVDIKPMQDAEYLVYYLGESRVILFNEYTNRVVYMINFNNRPSSVLSDNSIEETNEKNNSYFEFINESDLYVDSGARNVTPMLLSTFIVIILLQLCI